MREAGGWNNQAAREIHNMREICGPFTAPCRCKAPDPRVVTGAKCNAHSDIGRDIIGGCIPGDANKMNVLKNHARQCLYNSGSKRCEAQKLTVPSFHTLHEYLNDKGKEWEGGDRGWGRNGWT